MPNDVHNSVSVTATPEDDPNEKFRVLVATLTQIDRYLNPEAVARLISDKVKLRGHSLANLGEAIAYADGAFPHILKPGITPHQIAPQKPLAEQTIDERLSDYRNFFGPTSNGGEANKLMMNNPKEYRRLRILAVEAGVIA
jgi:hypothetical protein